MLALKLGTFRAGIIIRSPVKRLRPSLAGRIFTPNVPKPGRTTFSPFFRPGADRDGYLADVFSKKLYVQIGQNDTDTESLDMSAAANLQGERRYHRAKNFC